MCSQAVFRVTAGPQYSSQGIIGVKLLSSLSVCFLGDKGSGWLPIPFSLLKFLVSSVQCELENCTPAVEVRSLNFGAAGTKVSSGGLLL